MELSPARASLRRRSTRGFICALLCMRSCLGGQPIAKRLHVGLLQCTRRTDHVIGEAGRQTQLEWPHQPACGKVVGDQGAAAEHDSLSPDCSLDRVIGR